MKLYRFSPIKNEAELLKAITHVHFECHNLCKQNFGKYLPVSGNVGIFCHYDDEFERLIKIRKKLTDLNDNWNQKYFRLRKPIVIRAKGEIPETAYTYLYIRKPDPYRYQVGDVDFYLEPEKYRKLKESLQIGKRIKGARIFERPDIDQVELFDPNVDCCGYVSTHRMMDKSSLDTHVVKL